MARKTTNSALKQALHALKQNSPMPLTGEQLIALRPPGDIKTWTDEQFLLYREVVKLNVIMMTGDIARMKARIKYHERKLAAGSTMTSAVL